MSYATLCLMPTSSLRKLRKEATGLLRQYLAADDAHRTVIVREIAEKMVDAREQFTRHDGTPDWKGRTYPYRQWSHSVFADLNLPAEQTKSIQAAVRYHVGAVLRERLDAKEIESEGLISKTPRERAADRRTARTAVLHALEDRSLAGGSLVALSAAQSVLSRVDAEELAALDDQTQAIAVACLEGIVRRVEGLLARVDAGG